MSELSLDKVKKFFYQAVILNTIFSCMSHNESPQDVLHYFPENAALFWNCPIVYYPRQKQKL